jgi:hypothetical protein
VSTRKVSERNQCNWNDTNKQDWTFDQICFREVACSALIHSVWFFHCIVCANFDRFKAIVWTGINIYLFRVMNAHSEWHIRWNYVSVCRSKIVIKFFTPGFLIRSGSKHGCSFLQQGRNVLMKFFCFIFVIENYKIMRKLLFVFCGTNITTGHDFRVDYIING